MKRQYEDRIQQWIDHSTKALLIYGALFENFAAQELIAAGVTPYYYKNKKIGEIDFLIEREDKIIPIEIKSGKGYRNHAALNNLLSAEEYKPSQGYVLSTENTEVDGKCTYLPIYMIGFLGEKDTKDITIDLDKLL